MANTSIIQGSYTLSTGTVRSVGTLSSTISLTGSNYVAQNQNITSSAYVALVTSSLLDTRAGYFANNDASASISIATDNAGTNTIMVLSPDDSAYWVWSGSNCPLWAKSNRPVNGQYAVLEYIITES